MDRRSLLDEEDGVTNGTSDVFGDEFEVEDFDLVADGFGRAERPSQEVERADDYSGSQHERTTPVRSADSAMLPVGTGGPSRNSMRKSGTFANPFASPEDGAETSTRLTFESDPAAPHRSVSSASSNNFAQSDRPRFGAGPSHPYGLYSQGTLARSGSTATSSSMRPLQMQSSGLPGAGPQHPYTLYPQGVEDDLDREEHVQQNVGFLGLGQNYHRQRGPDGEEQDFVGADGHTEQLPPYTRYPEDGPEKAPLLVPAAPVALHSRAPVAGTDPGMPLMHTPLQPSQTPQPQPQSMTDASSLRRSASSAEQSRPLMADSLASKKSWSEKSWKEKRKTRVCGIPFWWILLSVCVLGFIAVVLGGVIGGFVEGVKKHKAANPTASSLYDASAAPTPSVNAPTGTFALSMGAPQETQAECLTQQGQQPAWSCDLSDTTAIAMSVGTSPGSNQTGAYIFYADADDTGITYGAQSSWMQTIFATFLTVTDNDSPNNGPAFYFQQVYDKLVILPESTFSAPSKQKRQRMQPPPPPPPPSHSAAPSDLHQFQRKQLAKSGDMPWFCVWNNTFVEGFIYVQQPIASTLTMPQASSTPTTASNLNATATGTSSWGPTSAAPTTSSVGQFSTTITLPSTTLTYAGPSSAYATWSARYVNAALYGGHDDGDHNKRQESAKFRRQLTGGEMYESLAIYPNLVKIEERRLPGNKVQPYCQQYKILDDGGYNPAVDASGNPIIITLQESDPSYSAYQSAGVAGSQKSKRLVSGSCHCQWMSGQ